MQHIAKTPGVCGGRACIAGHRIRVMDIVVWHEMRGCTAAEVAEMFPGITRAMFTLAGELTISTTLRKSTMTFATTKSLAGPIGPSEHAVAKIPPELREKIGG